MSAYNDVPASGSYFPVSSFAPISAAGADEALARSATASTVATTTFCMSTHPGAPLSPPAARKPRVVRESSQAPVRFRSGRDRQREGRFRLLHVRLRLLQHFRR